MDDMTQGDVVLGVSEMTADASMAGGSKLIGQATEGLNPRIPLWSSCKVCGMSKGSCVVLVEEWKGGERCGSLFYDSYWGGVLFS
jgi:hypothetical protein